MRSRFSFLQTVPALTPSVRHTVVEVAASPAPRETITAACGGLDSGAGLAKVRARTADGAERSPVARLGWDQEGPGSNPGAPTLRIVSPARTSAAGHFRRGPTCCEWCCELVSAHRLTIRWVGCGTTLRIVSGSACW